MAFARKMEQLSQHLKQHRRGCPVAEGDVSPGQHTVFWMSGGETICGDFPAADLASVFVYLRGGKNLEIPDQWRSLIPRRLDLS